MAWQCQLSLCVPIVAYRRPARVCGTFDGQVALKHLRFARGIHVPSLRGFRVLTMEFDEVLSELGDLGRYQLVLFALLCVPASLPPAISLFSHTFIAAVPGHRCRSRASEEKASLLNSSLAVTEVSIWSSRFNPQLSFSTVHSFELTPGITSTGSSKTRRPYFKSINSTVDGLCCAQEAGLRAFKSHRPRFGT